MSTKAQHDPDYLPLPPYLRTLREAAGLTQRDVGRELGKPQSWVHNCEIGNRRVDLTEFVKWAAACGVDPVAALTGFLEVVSASPPKRKTRPPGRRDPSQKYDG